jgi:hypothetical protein
MKKILLRFPGSFAIAWALVIFILCATPGEYIPSNNWLELLSVDKLVHASIFFILTTLCFAYTIRQKKDRTSRIFFCTLCILYGALLELMQGYCFRNRSADWQDMVANALGCLLAFLFFQKLRKIVMTLAVTNGEKGTRG